MFSRLPLAPELVTQASALEGSSSASASAPAVRITSCSTFWRRISLYSRGKAEAWMESALAMASPTTSSTRACTASLTMQSRTLMQQPSRSSQATIRRCASLTNLAAAQGPTSRQIRCTMPSEAEPTLALHSLPTRSSPLRMCTTLSPSPTQSCARLASPSRTPLVRFRRGGSSQLKICLPVQRGPWTDARPAAS